MWNYQREETTFDVIPEGVHRIRVRSAERAVSKSGNDMLVLQFDVSGYSGSLWNYIVFMQDRPEITNRRLTQFFDSFKDIGDGNFNLASWVGKVGACMVEHEEYNGQTRARLKYFVPAEQQTTLPPWSGGDADMVEVNTREDIEALF